MRSAKYPEFERNVTLYKQCSTCSLEKEANVENFPPRASRYSRFESQCRACVRAQETAHRNANIEHERKAAAYLNDQRGRLAYIGATMDLLHPGHVRFLQWAKSVCKVVVVALNTDDFVAQYKSRPIQTLAERTEMLDGCRYVDGVTVNVGGAS